MASLAPLQLGYSAILLLYKHAELSFDCIHFLLHRLQNLSLVVFSILFSNDFVVFDLILLVPNKAGVFVLKLMAELLGVFNHGVLSVAAPVGFTYNSSNIIGKSLHVLIIAEL